jgi:glutamine amidotransferase
MIRKLGHYPTLTSEKADLKNASHIIIPGVGSFDKGMGNLHDLDLVGPLTELVIGKSVPALGICLGMQLMGTSSQEGTRDGLGWIDARAVKFEFDDQSVKVPHMGWNDVESCAKDPLFDKLHESNKFYFAHSFHVVCSDNRYVIGQTEYGIRFMSSFRRGNLAGVQFHPEKSHRYGMQLLRNFIEAFDGGKAQEA